MDSYPEELLIPPAPLIAVLSDGAWARTLVGSLKTAPGHPVRVRYDLFKLSQRFPRKERTHGQDYETYVPHGILRANWMHKHATLVPAVLVRARARVVEARFPGLSSLPRPQVIAWPIDLRMPGADWTAREGALVTAVQSAREFVRGRGQEVLVVLVNEGPPPARGPSGEDYGDILAERVTAVRRKSGLDGNAVTVLMAADVGVPGSPLIQGLDGILKDRALAFYQSYTRRLKKSLVRVTLPTQAGLRARLLFKIGHFQEYRSRPGKAIKYFSLSFAALLTVAGILPSLLGEAKAVADLVNFKLVQRYLSGGLGMVTTPTGVTLPGAQAATMQFNAYMRAFETALTADERARPWLQFAWLSRQYEVLAQMLASNLPPPGPDTRSAYIPAPYYHTAALHAIKRRRAAEAEGVIPCLSVVLEEGDQGEGPLVATIQGLEEVRTVGTSTPAVTPKTVACEAEIRKWAVATSSYVGSRPLVAAIGAGGAVSGTPVTADMSQPVLAAAAHVAESRANHSALIIALLEKAQAMSTVDGGAGSATRLFVTPKAGEADSLYFARGSVFTYEVGPDASRTRLWRQALLADEAFAGGRVDAALRLLLPVAERYRCERWPALQARTLQRMRECAAVLGDVPAFVASSVELLAVSQRTSIGATGRVAQLQGHLARVLRAAAGVKTALLTLPLPSPSLLPSDDSVAASFVRAPSPARCTASLRAPDAPLLSAVVSFSNRCAQRGSSVLVRLILTSALPRSIGLEEVVLTFAHAEGDLPLRSEGQGAESARPFMSGMRQLEGASPFDVILRNGALPEGSRTEEGVLTLTSGAAPPGSGPRILTLPLLLPGKGSLAVEYEVELGTAGGGGDERQAVDEVIAPVPPEAALADARAAVIAGSSDSSAGGAAFGSPALNTLERWNSSCTDPVTMASVLQAGEGGGVHVRAATTPAAGWDPKTETVVPSRIAVTWRGREEGAEAPTGTGAALVLDLLPRPFGTAASGRSEVVEATPTTPGPGVTPIDAILACMSAHRLPAIMTLGDAMPAPVAHMVRTGVGLGPARGLVGAFAPGSGGIGFSYEEDPIPPQVRGGVPPADAAAVQAAAEAGAAFVGVGGSREITAASGLGGAAVWGSQWGAHETDGSACGKALPYHPILLVLGPDAHARMTIASSWPGAAADAPPVAVLRVPSPIRVSISCGRRGMAGGVLKLAAAASWLPPGSVLASAASDLRDAASGMADVGLAVDGISATSGVGSSSSALVEAGVAADSAGVREPEDRAASLLVHEDTLVLTASGKRARAGDVGCARSAGLCVLSGPPIVGIALPALPSGVAFALTAYVLVDDAGAAGGTACVSLSWEVRLAEEDGTQAVEGDDWLATLSRRPLALRCLGGRVTLPAYPALALRASVLPDPSAPLLDLAALLLPPNGPAKAWALGQSSATNARPPALLAAAGAGAVYSALTASDCAGHVRTVSSPVLVVELVANPVLPVLLSDCGLVPAGEGVIRVAVDGASVRAQLGLSRPHAAGASALAVAVAAALATLPPASSGLRIEAGRAASLALPLQVGPAGGVCVSPGALTLSWRACGGGEAAVASIAHPLPRVAVHTPPLRLQITYPQSPTAGVRCTLSLQLTNASAHFHAVEVAATAPSSLPPQGQVVAGPSGAAARPVAPSPSLLPVPALELVGYARYIVELLPGASKTVSFGLMPHAEGHAALPRVTLRAVTGAKSATPLGEAQAPRTLAPAGDVLLALVAAAVLRNGSGAPAEQVAAPLTVFVGAAVTVMGHFACTR
jgi:hypothetical protein